LKNRNISKLNIFFGNVESKVKPEDIRSILEEKKQELSLTALLFLHQVHGNQGLLIASQEQADNLQPHSYDGDYLITQLTQVGLGVLTADCLPIIVYDKETQSIGIAHAGWRGSVQQIGVRMIEHMMREFGTKKESLQVFFGPAAGVCCYEVDASFLKNIEQFSYAVPVILSHNNKFYFDVPLFNSLQLQDFGVKPEQIDTTQTLCTIENTLFCSHRREPKNPERNISIVSLQENAL